MMNQPDFPVMPSIREATSADAPLLAELIRASFLDVADQFGLSASNCPTHPSNCTTDWIEPDWARRGLGELLVRHVLDEARRMGVHSVEIGIIAEHHELRAWYERAGIHPEGDETISAKRSGRDEVRTVQCTIPSPAQRS